MSCLWRRLTAGVGNGCAHVTAMLMLTLSLLTLGPRTTSVVLALRHLMVQARSRRGCLDTALTADLVEPTRLHYVEAWADEATFKEEVRSERFSRLIALMETAAEPPAFAVHRVPESHGLEYVVRARTGAAA